jgi:chlorobactene lauroyltransferase
MNESRFLIWFFTTYTRWLYWRTFAKVDIQSEYSPAPGQSTLYILNHHYWFDALTPLLLNHSHFHQHLMAIMDKVQMEKRPFFAKLGAIPIDRSHARSAVNTLDQAADWLSEPGTCVFLYPQGKLTDSIEPIVLESGVVRLIDNAPMADVVAIGMYIHFRNGPKPELVIRIGKPIVFPSNAPKALVLQTVQHAINHELDKITGKKNF